MLFVCVLLVVLLICRLQYHSRRYLYSGKGTVRA